MAKYPGADWRPLPENSTQPKIRPTQLIYHTAVDAPGPTDLGKYFARTDVVEESHFFVHRDGSCNQFMDTEVQADANYKANVRAISVETEDDGDPNNPWTPAQLDTMRAIALWANQIHGIPLKPCPAWDQPGLGFHSMWGFKDNRLLKGVLDNPWSPSKGKPCPGVVRVAQFWDVLIPSFNSSSVILISNKVPIDMTPDQIEAVKAIQRAIASWGPKVDPDGDPGPLTVKALNDVLAYASWQMGVYKDQIERAKQILNG